MGASEAYSFSQNTYSVQESPVMLFQSDNSEFCNAMVNLLNNGFYNH